MNVNELLRTFLDSAAVHIYVVERGTDNILLVNNYYANHLGVSRAYMEAHKCWEFVDPDKGQCAFCPRNAKIDENSLDGQNMRIAQAFNPTLGIWGKYTSYPITWIDGREADIITLTDMSTEKMLRDRLEKLAYYDKVTGLPNRIRLELDITARKSDRFCAVAFGNIALRDINDQYGRSTGDKLLIAIIEWVRSLDLKDTEIYRVDGNAFCMLIYNAALSSVENLAQKMQRRFKEVWNIPTAKGDAALSADIAICVTDGRNGYADCNALVSSVEHGLDLSAAQHTITVCGPR